MQHRLLRVSPRIIRQINNLRTQSFLIITSLPNLKQWLRNFFAVPKRPTLIYNLNCSSVTGLCGAGVLTHPDPFLIFTAIGQAAPRGISITSDTFFILPSAVMKSGDLISMNSLALYLAWDSASSLADAAAYESAFIFIISRYCCLLYSSHVRRNNLVLT